MKDLYDEIEKKNLELSHMKKHPQNYLRDGDVDDLTGNIYDKMTADQRRKA